MLNRFLLPRCIFFVFSFFMVGCNAQSIGCKTFSEIEESGLKEIIVKGGFSGELDVYASLKYVGCYEHEENGLGVYFYEREFGNARLTQRLLVVSSKEGYLGMYAVPEPPESVVGSEIKFSFPDDYGNHISLKGDALPKVVLLDCEEFELFK